jgi:hypothetical protein
LEGETLTRERLYQFPLGQPLVPDRKENKGLVVGLRGFCMTTRPHLPDFQRKQDAKDILIRDE